LRRKKLNSSVMRHKPSPAFIISVIALIVAVGGGTFAIAASDKKKDKKIANKVVTKRAPGLSVLHAKTADNATNADNATSAGGMRVVKIYAEQAPGTGTQTIASGNGFTITASCGAADEVTADVNAPSGPDTLAESQGNNDNGGPFTDEDETNSGSSVDLVGDPGTVTDGGSTFTATAEGGHGVSGQIEFKPANETYSPNVCVYSGFAFFS
jgi:hypothetical protein